MYPYKFKPIFKPTLWGGNKIAKFKRIQSPEQIQAGESWEISCIPGYESVVSNGTDIGKSLHELIKEHKSLLVGKENYQQFGDHFPLLVKFIDACDELSIQVHPNDALAQARHQTMGKTEMWYIIDNEHGKGHLCPGLKQPITPEDFTSLIEENRICDVLANYPVQPGDAFYLPAGRIHGIGAGCFIAEIQQSSDITYRIYDYNRKDKNGNSRELHTELAKDAIDYNVANDYHIPYTAMENEPVELINSPYFTTSVYNLTENMTMDYSELDSFVILVCVEGSCSICDNEKNVVELHAGETVLLPATTQEVNVYVEEQVKFLETYV